MADRIKLTGKLGKGKYLIVDEGDYDSVSQFKWYPVIGENTTYACRYRGKENGTAKFFMVHRMLMKARPGEVVDHINGNGLDNRRENLRLTTAAGNAYNRVFRNRRTATDCLNVYKEDKRSDSTFYVSFDAKDKDFGFGTYRNLKMADRIANIVRARIHERIRDMDSVELLAQIRNEMREAGEINVR